MMSLVLLALVLLLSEGMLDQAPALHLVPVCLFAMVPQDEAAYVLTVWHVPSVSQLVRWHSLN